MRLFLISKAIDTIFTESHSFSIEDSFDGFFIIAQCCIATLQLEKYDFSKSSLRKSIEDDVVSSLPDEDHIFRCIGKIWKYGENLLIEFTDDLITTASQCRFPYVLVFEEREDTHDRHTDHETEYETGDEGKCIHFLFFSFRLSHFFIYYANLLINQIMISVICTNDTLVRDAFANALSLEKMDDTPQKTIYQRAKWILIFFKWEFVQEDLEWIVSSYIPDRLYIPYFGTSIDLVHETWDVVVPNVFFSYDLALDTLEVTGANRDTLIDVPVFLTHLEEQKDYYVEDYGLSVGGIVVQDTPKVISDELATKLMLAYEADLYVTNSLRKSLEIAQDEGIPSLILCGITTGKPAKNQGNTSAIDFTVKNMITTIRLLEEE